MGKLDPDNDLPRQLRHHIRLDALPLGLRNGALLVVGEPQTETLDVEIDRIGPDLVRDLPLVEDGSEARVGKIPCLLVPRVRLILHRPLRPAAVLQLPGETALPELYEHRSGADGRRRRPAEDRLRIRAVGNGVLERALLIVLVLLRLVDHQKIEALAETALAGAGAKLDLSAVLQEDVLPAVGTVCAGYRDAGLLQHIVKPLPRRVRRGRPVCGVQDVLAVFQPEDLAHDDDLVLAVTPRDRVAEFRMHPQTGLVRGENVPQQKHLPPLRGAAGPLVKLHGLVVPAHLVLIPAEDQLRRILAAAPFFHEPFLSKKLAFSKHSAYNRDEMRNHLAVYTSSDLDVLGG